MTKPGDIKILEYLKSRSHQNEGVKLLLEKYGTALYGFILIYTHQQPDADDVFQEVLIKVVKKIKKFQGQSTLKTWVWQIAKNQCIDFLRKKRRMELNIEKTTSYSSNKLVEEPYFNGDEILKKLHEEVSQLPESQKNVFILRYFEGMSYREIAQITGKTENNLKTSFHYASKSIAENMKSLL
nr:sigma-70 family RNA polymerase sigma factor [Saprospiraceae bacterium]